MHYAGLEAGVRTDKITTHNYEVHRRSQRVIWVSSAITLRLGTGKAGSAIAKIIAIERIGGNVDSNALRAALLDTNPATAFNPFGLNQNSPEVLDKIFATTHRRGTASLILEDLKLYGELWNLPAGPIAFAIGGEHRTEYEKDQPDALTASRSSNWRV